MKCPYRKIYIFEYELQLAQPDSIKTVKEEFEECLKEDCMAFSRDGQSCKRD